MGSTTELAVSLGNLSRELHGVASAASSAASAVTDMGKAANDTGGSIKQATDPLAEFTKLLGDVPQAAAYLQPTFEKLVKQFQDGKISIADMREEMQKLLSQLNEWGQGDRRWGDAGQLNGLFQALEKLLNGMQNGGRP